MTPQTPAPELGLGGAGTVPATRLENGQPGAKDRPPAVGEGEAPAAGGPIKQTWTLQLPFTRPPLSLNDRDHWAEKAAKTKAVKDAVIVLARHARIPHCERIAVELHYVPAVKRRRDLDNVAATVKPISDALVHVGAVRDDSHDLLTPSVVIHPPSRPGRLYVVVRRLA